MKKKIKRKHRYHLKQKPNSNWVYKINSSSTQRGEVLLAYHSSPGLTMTVYGPRYGVTNYQTYSTVVSRSSNKYSLVAKLCISGVPSGTASTACSTSKKQRSFWDKIKFIFRSLKGDKKCLN